MTIDRIEVNKNRYQLLSISSHSSSNRGLHSASNDWKIISIDYLRPLSHIQNKLQLISGNWTQFSTRGSQLVIFSLEILFAESVLILSCVKNRRNSWRLDMKLSSRFVCRKCQRANGSDIFEHYDECQYHVHDSGWCDVGISCVEIIFLC